MAINISIPDFINNNLTQIEVQQCYKYCVIPDYTFILLLTSIILAIPYLNINIWLAKKLEIEPMKDSDEFRDRIFKRIFSDMFYIGSALWLNVGFFLYNIMFL